jgi:hypothetical protein
LHHYSACATSSMDPRWTRVTGRRRWPRS